MRKLGLALAAVVTAATFAMTVAASALPITLTLTGPIAGNTVGPQSTSNPCVICGTNAQNPATFGYNNFTESGSIHSYNMYSTSTTPSATVPDGMQGAPYTVSQIQAAVGAGPFDVAIDVNTTGAQSETLQLFEVFDVHMGVETVIYNYKGPTVIGAVNNNGNGFADWTLGKIDLSGLGLDSTDGILFHAFWNNAVDGAESFFLISAVKVPEPGTWITMLAGLLGTGWMLRRARKSEVSRTTA
jgi:hypothetical protein